MNDKDSKLYTGLSKAVFLSLVSALVAFLLKPMNFKLPVHQQAVTRTTRIANIRIHVERAIRRLKCFNILCNVIPEKM